MQDIYKKIFEIANNESSNKLHKFHNEESIFCAGFKTSKKVSGEYAWEDMRYSDFYEPVDPKITEQVLLQGFTKTLKEVMHHNDKDKVLHIKREVEKIDAQVKMWVSKSNELWNEYNKQTKRTRANEIDEGKKKTRLSALKKRYERDKALYQKKRRVLVEEKEEIRKDLVFYETRIKMYNK